MNSNKLTVRISKPISEVFDFTISPYNTPWWVDFIAEETIDEKEIKLGTIYKNKDKGKTKRGNGGKRENK